MTGQEMDGLSAGSIRAQAPPKSPLAPGVRLALGVPADAANEIMADEIARDEIQAVLDRDGPVNWHRIGRIINGYEPARRAFLVRLDDGPGDGYVLAVMVLALLATGAAVHELIGRMF